MKKLTAEEAYLFTVLFNKLQAQSCDIERRKGLQKYKKNPLYVPAKLALVMSEAVEALEWHRAGKYAEIGHDLADIVLRTIDLAGVLKINLAEEILKKTAVNEERAKAKSKARY